MGLNLWFLGYPDQALARCGEAVEFAGELKSVSSLLVMLLCKGWTHMWRGEFREAREVFGEVRGQADEAGMAAYFEPIADQYEGSCLAREGEVAQGIEWMQRGLEAWRAMEWEVWLAYGAALLADGLRLDGRSEDGLALLEATRASVSTTDDLTNESEVLRVKGELHLALPQAEPGEAENAFRSAIGVARDQHARSSELRATTSLARLLRDTDRSDEAREMLSEIYGWFTEGLDTADLKEAKALLEELGPADQTGDPP
jgi:adenylate cyclase